MVNILQSHGIAAIQYKYSSTIDSHETAYGIDLFLSKLICSFEDHIRSPDVVPCHKIVIRTLHQNEIIHKLKGSHFRLKLVWITVFPLVNYIPHQSRPIF